MIAAWAASLVIAAATAAPPDLGAIADAAIARPMERGVCDALAIGVTKDGAEVTRYAGETGHGVPDATTIWQIGSVTKIFTATLLALEVQRGRMKLDDPAQLYVPPNITLPGKRPMTLLHLATHMSGLPRKVPGNEQLTLPAMYAFIQDYRLPAPPGSTFLYSNLGVGLLGQLIARFENAPVGALYRREITGPLGMTDTTFHLTPDQRPRFAIGHGPRGREAPETVPGWPVLESAGALYSTLPDMMRFLRYQLDGAPGDLGAIRPMMRQPRFDTPNGAKVGLSWEVHDLGGHTMIGKDGATLGFSAYLGFVPETRTGAMVLSNSKACPVRLINDRILSALNGLPPPDNAPPTDDAGAD